MEPVPARARRWAAPLATAYVALCLYPHLLRLGHPSLYCDDVARVGQLQVLPLGRLLFLPFNEHMAPLFNVVSWVAWRLAGRRLVHMPLALTLASLVPFALCLAALGLLVRRAFGSTTAALGAVAALNLSSLYVEVFWWYSASSFAWALLWTLVVLLALGRGGRAGWVGAAVAAMLAPACSAIGLLAGPAGAVRALAAADRPSRRDRLAGASAAMAGTLLYLAVCSLFRYRDVLADSVRTKGDLGAGLRAAARAPVVVLVPELFGVREAYRWTPPRLDLALAGVALVAALAWARRSRNRPWVLVGLVLILGGYALTYCVRAEFGRPWIFVVQRYHLFPQVGLLLLLAAALAPRLRRLDARPARGLAAATGLAVLLLAAHLGEMKARARALRFPDQARTLAALERLAATCTRLGITRDQALYVLDPVRPHWFPIEPFSALMMLAPTVEAPRVAGPLVRPTLLAALPPADREALFGGMDASAYLRPAAVQPGAETVAVGRLVGSFRVRAAGPDGPFESEGWPAYLEFEMSNFRSEIPGAGAHVLSLPGGATGQEMEVWWAPAGGRWSEARSIHLRPDPRRSAAAWTVPLDTLPHWDPERARRLRVLFHMPGPIAAGTPKLLR
jgi:hypothetical protein